MTEAVVPVHKKRMGWPSRLGITASVCLLLAAIYFHQEETLEYFKVVLAPAPMAALVALIFVFRFKQPISTLIEKIRRVSVLGNEINAEESQSKALAVPVNLNVIASPGSSALEVTSNPENIAALVWEYRFLGVFLVYRTKNVLAAIASTPEATTIEQYEAALSQANVEEQERRAVLRALVSYHLIEVGDDRILHVTKKGRDFLQWHGPIQPPPAQLSGGVTVPMAIAEGKIETG